MNFLYNDLAVLHLKSVGDSIWAHPGELVCEILRLAMLTIATNHQLFLYILTHWSIVNAQDTLNSQTFVDI